LGALVKQRTDEIALLPAEVREGGRSVHDTMVRDLDLGRLADRVDRMIHRLETFVDEMDFRFLYNFERNLFSVGFNLSLGRLDTAHYDLLASEASLTSFLAIARGQAPRKHWFQLSRPLTRVGGAPCLLSWGGTMFEYLMPRLFLKSLPETLIEES